jgi:hypothetical protein
VITWDFHAFLVTVFTRFDQLFAFYGEVAASTSTTTAVLGLSRKIALLLSRAECGVKRANGPAKKVRPNATLNRTHIEETQMTKGNERYSVETMMRADPWRLKSENYGKKAQCLRFTCIKQHKSQTFFWYLTSKRS